MKVKFSKMQNPSKLKRSTKMKLSEIKLRSNVNYIESSDIFHCNSLGLFIFAAK